MLLNNKALKYTFFRHFALKYVTKYQQRKTGKTRKKGVRMRCGGKHAIIGYDPTTDNKPLMI